MEKIWQKVKEKLNTFISPSFDAIQIEPEVIHDISALAKGSHPKEMIAFLTGNIKKVEERRILTIDGLYVKAYQADERSTHFTTHDLPMSPVYGTVHSHPGPSNRPSSADKRLFNKQGYFHLIICMPYTRENIAVYNKRGEEMSIDF